MSVNAESPTLLRYVGNPWGSKHRNVLNLGCSFLQGRPNAYKAMRLFILESHMKGYYEEFTYSLIGY
jgi:hypothetical protein